MGKAKIDILLPYWGEFSLLKKTVDSVLAQTEPGWQLLIFDDAYPSDEAKKYFAKLNDRRVVYYRHRKNIGITKNFNFALNAARSKYCVVLGCDDKLLPDYIKTVLKNIGDVDFYQPGVEVIDDNDELYNPTVDKIKSLIRPKKSGIYYGEKLASSLCVGNWLYFPSITWKTDVVKRYKFDTLHDNMQDVILELTMVMEGRKLFVDNEVTFQYRRSANSWSSRRKSKAGGRFSEENEIYNNFAKDFRRNGWYTAALSARLHATSRLHRILASIQTGSIL
jgi:glycosyltransferase involved in cell wall biosynthesis